MGQQTCRGNEQEPEKVRRPRSHFTQRLHVPQPYAASFLVRKWRFHSLLAVGNPLLTIRLIQIIENVFGFRQHDVPILENRNIVLA